MKTNQMTTKQRWVLLAACLVFGLLLPAIFLLPDSAPSAEPAQPVPTRANSAKAPPSESGAGQVETQRQVLDQTPDYGSMLLETVLSLVLVCLLAFVVLKWGLGRLYGVDREGGSMSVVSRMRLGPKRELLVARVGPRHLILGSTEHQLNVLGELSAAEAADHFEPRDAGEGTDG
ncbi:MAG: flagellar biosynthetic protein FliO [Myxococcota bacterium]